LSLYHHQVRIPILLKELMLAIQFDRVSVKDNEEVQIQDALI